MSVVKFKFPLTPGSQNHKAVREALLLDSVGSGVEKTLVGAAEAARGADQEVFVHRGYTKKGRLSVWLVDRDGKGKDSERNKRLKEALARVQL